MAQYATSDGDDDDSGEYNNNRPPSRRLAFELPSEEPSPPPKPVAPAVAAPRERPNQVASPPAATTTQRQTQRPTSTPHSTSAPSVARTKNTPQSLAQSLPPSSPPPSQSAATTATCSVCGAAIQTHHSWQTMHMACIAAGGAAADYVARNGNNSGGGGTMLDFGFSSSLAEHLAQQSSYVDDARLRATDAYRRNQEAARTEYELRRTYRGVPSHAVGASEPTGLLSSMLRFTGLSSSSTTAAAKRAADLSNVPLACDVAEVLSLIRADERSSAFGRINNGESTDSLIGNGVTAVDLVTDAAVTTYWLVERGYTPRDWATLGLTKDQLFTLNLSHHTLLFENVVEELIECYRFKIGDFMRICNDDWTTLGKLNLAVQILQELGVTVDYMSATRTMTRDAVVQYFNYSFDQWNKHLGLATPLAFQKLIAIGVTYDDCVEMRWEKLLFNQKFGRPLESFFEHAATPPPPAATTAAASVLHSPPPPTSSTTLKTSSSPSAARPAAAAAAVAATTVAAPAAVATTAHNSQPQQQPQKNARNIAAFHRMLATGNTR